MLLAILLGGLAAAIATPLILTGDDAGPDPDDDDGAGSAASPEHAPGAPTSSPLFPGAVYDIPAAPATLTLDRFDPAADRVQLHLDSGAEELTETVNEAGHPVLSVSVESGQTTLVFPNLTAVPAGAIDLLLDEGGTGSGVRIALGDLESPDGLEDAVEGPGAPTVFVLDGWGDEIPVDSDHRDPLPLAPGPGDAADLPTLPTHDLPPVAPQPGDAVDSLPDSLEDILPVRPGAGDEISPLMPRGD